MEIRELNIQDKASLLQLIDIIEENLIDKTWWLPIQDKAKENFLNREWTVFYGMFDGEKLVGASALFLNEYEFGDTALYIKDKIEGKIGEIGRCMILPEYRGKNYLHLINVELVKEAKSLDVACLVATAHPENLPSNKSLQKLGMKKVAYVVKKGKYPRNILFAKVNEL